MTLDKTILNEARELRSRLLELQHDADRAKLDYHHAIRRLHGGGGSMRDRRRARSQPPARAPDRRGRRADPRPDRLAARAPRPSFRPAPLHPRCTPRRHAGAEGGARTRRRGDRPRAPAPGPRGRRAGNRRPRPRGSGRRSRSPAGRGRGRARARAVTRPGCPSPGRRRTSSRPRSSRRSTSSTTGSEASTSCSRSWPRAVGRSSCSNGSTRSPTRSAG